MSFSKYNKIYFLGIGGIGMSALARYFNHAGMKVSGYDKTSTELTRKLENEGIKIHYTDTGREVIASNDLNANETLVIITPAIPANFGEWKVLQENNFTIKKRAEILGMISESYTTIAVAGTHGKTTTSCLVAHLIYSSGKNCLAFLGGIATNYNTNLLLPFNGTTAPICVVEADEYDRSFLKLSPSLSIINNMDPDHLDIYGSEEEFRKGFNDFAGKLREGGKLFYKKGLPLHLNEIGNYSFSLKEKEADIYSENVRIENGIYIFDYKNNASGINFRNLQSGIPGFHNVENAIAAISVAIEVGLTEEEIRNGLKSFKGVKRRFEFIINHPKKIFIDDYAHHPEELRAFITSAKALYRDKKITGAFQPHLFTRTRDFVDGFAETLSLLDEVILLDIYPARELPIEGVTSKIIFDKITTKKSRCTKEELANLVEEKNPEVFVILGAGDIDALVLPVKKVLLHKNAGLFADDLQALIEGTVLLHEPMQKHTWLKIGGTADVFVKPKNNNDILLALNYASEHNIPYFVLGNGSNLLVGDGGIRGIVIAVADADTYFKQENNLFSVSASYSLPKFVLDSLKLGYEGLEALAGVPATIGGATRMNAGAYGTEIFDCIHSVKFIRHGVVLEKQKNEINFSYRHTEFENDIILETTFSLSKADDIDAVALKRKELLEKRKDAQPLDKPNTGSVFKNPLPQHAGKLIEDAGLKGYAHGHVQVSPKHANFIVNNGGATAKEFRELVNTIIKTVEEKFKVRLHTEVMQVGEE
jgi:UDP-N-acetylmuramate--alanine ligase